MDILNQLMTRLASDILHSKTSQKHDYDHLQQCVAVSGIIKRPEYVTSNVPNEQILNVRLCICAHTHTAVSVALLERSAQNGKKIKQVAKRKQINRKNKTLYHGSGPPPVRRRAIDFALVSKPKVLIGPEDLAPLSLIVSSSSSSPKVLNFFLDPRSSCDWECRSYTGTPPPPPHKSLCGFMCV